MGNTEQFVPQARKEGLLIQELPDEVLVYDLDRHKAHCLNRTAALIWKQCDGQSTVTEVARHLEKELGTPVAEEVVWLGLDQLGKARLLPERIARDGNRVSRRDIIRKMGVAAAVGLPLITSIVAPTASQAVTCVAPGGACTAPPQCCDLVCDNSGTCL